MNIKLLGAHNCESQSTRYPSLLIDHSLVLDAGGLTSSLSFADQQKVKAILLTHQHYDHIRDIPAIAMNFYLRGATLDVYAALPVYETLAALLNNKLYPNFLERPPVQPTIRFKAVEPFRIEQVDQYQVLPVPVKHSVPALGYQVASAEGKALFYSGDTGPGLADCWERTSPQLLVIEVTAPNRYNGFARESGHLTPSLLRDELLVFQRLKGYLPPVVTIHMNPELEPEIEREIAMVAEELNHAIVLGREGMELHV